jgi:UrcA family protein
VQTADLDLARAAGRATHDKSIGAAVEKVCAPTAQYPVEEMRDYDRCISQASDTAKLRTVELIAASTKNRTLARR